MKCCYNKLILNSFQNVPPDINPPVGEQKYLYVVGIQGENYDPFNDTYNYLTVAGIDYNTGGSLLSTDNGGDVATAISSNFASAIPDQVNNGVGYSGFSWDFFTYPYVFIFWCTEAQNISINVTIGGNTINIPVTGGAVSMINKCTTVNVADPTTEAYSYTTFTIKNHLGVNFQPFIAPNIGINLSNTVAYESELKTTYGCFNQVIPFVVSGQDNGSDYTLTVTTPSAYLTLDSGTYVPSGTANYSNC